MHVKDEYVSDKIIARTYIRVIWARGRSIWNMGLAKVFEEMCRVLHALLVSVDLCFRKRLQYNVDPRQNGGTPGRGSG
jgi:hypothetical protein